MAHYGSVWSDSPVVGESPFSGTLNSVLQMHKMGCHVCCEVLEPRELETIHATRDVDTGWRSDLDRKD